MNKKHKEDIYRDSIKGDRWRFIREETHPLSKTTWFMTRVKDGYRTYWSPEQMTLEKK